MEQEVYADLLFLINAGMDGLCLCLCGRLLHRPLSPPRVLIASVLGGIYAVIALFLTVGQIAALLIDALVMCGLCTVAFASGKRSISGIGLCSLVFLAVSMTVGGIMTALFNLLNQAGIADRLPDSTTEDGPSTWLFLLLSAAAGLCAALGGRFFRRATATQSCRVIVEMDGRRVTLEGMTDSGNLMRDPIGGLPVVAVDQEAVLPLLSPALRTACAQEHPDLAALSQHAEGRRIRLIPCSTATGHRLIPALLPDSLTIIPASGTPHTVRALFAPTPLSDKAHLQALVPSELML